MRLLILASMLALLAVRSVDGCTTTYVHTPIHDLALQARAIFIGELVGTEGVKGDPQRTVSFRVLRTLKSTGPLPEIYTLPDAGGCYSIKELTPWLIYARPDPTTGEIRADAACDNKAVDNARPNIEFIEAWASGGDPTQIVIHVDDPGIEVVIRSAGQDYRATSRLDGLAVFTGIPTGSYRVRAQGDGYRSDYLEEPVIAVVGQASSDMQGGQLETTNELSGILRGPDGHPLAGVEVEAVSVIDERAGIVEAYAGLPSVTDHLGRFSFRGLDPDRYVIGLNVTRSKEPPPFPPTFYPGVESLSEATVLALAAGDRRNHLDFQIQRRLKQRPTTVRVVWSDGTLAEGAGVGTEHESSERNTAYFPSFAGDRSNDEGRLDLVLFEGMRYRLQAVHFSVLAMANRKPLGESQTIEVEPDTGPLELTFTLRRYLNGLCGAKEWIDP